MYGHEFQILFGGRAPADLEESLGDTTEIRHIDDGLEHLETAGRDFDGPLSGLKGLRVS